jgi:hypothetical protein
MPKHIADDEMGSASVMLSKLAVNRNHEMQYYLPPGSCDDAQSLLEYEDLTDQDVLDFVSRGTLTPVTADAAAQCKQDLLEAYHKRRREIRDLAWKVWEGQALVDEDGRLVPIGENEGDNAALQGGEPRQLPPLRNRNNEVNNMAIAPGLDAPAAGPAANMNNQMNDMNMNNNNNINLLVPPIVNHNIPFPLDQEEEERRWTEEEEREAASSIARAVERYRKEGIPDQEYVLLRVPPMERPERASLTFRRICFAVLAVVTAFICIMLQTIPLFPRDKRSDPLFDKLLYELLQVRHFEHHARACPNLHRSPPGPSAPSAYPSWWEVAIQPSTWGQLSQSQLSSNQPRTNSRNVDCSEGVVHIPTKTVLVDSFLESSTKREADFWKPYLSGVNVSWFMPCHPPGNTSSLCQPQTSKAQPGNDSCPILADSSETDVASHKCFRGIHDNIISDHEVGEALRWGAEMIQAGGDHFDLHTEVDHMEELERRLPNLLKSIRRLLQDSYHAVPGESNQILRPVAFRVSAVGPLDGRDVVPLHGSLSQTSNYLIRILKRQVGGRRVFSCCCSWKVTFTHCLFFNVPSTCH